MSINTADAPRAEITIVGVALKVPAPFVEGHVLRENEASVLNQTYAENIRNNFASSVKAAKEAADKAGTSLDPQMLQLELDEYVSNYDFGIRRAGTRTAVDPIEREALIIARAKVKAALKKKGHKVADIAKEKIEELAKDVLARYPIILEQAAKVVALRKEVGAESLDVEA